MKLRILLIACIICLILGGCDGFAKKDYTALSFEAQSAFDVIVPAAGVYVVSDDPAAYEPDAGLAEDSGAYIPDESTADDSGKYIPDGSFADGEGSYIADDSVRPDNDGVSDVSDQNVLPIETATATGDSTEDTGIPGGDKTSSDDGRNSDDTGFTGSVRSTYRNADDDASDPYGYRSTDALAGHVSDIMEKAAPTAFMSFSELVGDNGIYDLPEGFPEPGTYRIIVDKYYQLVMVFSRDADGEYTVPVRFMLCSTGTSSTPTRSGTFHLKSYRVRFGLFNNTDSYAQYWSQIDGRMYFHSVLYSDRKASSYTGSYNNLGGRASHGCIRLTVPDARWIWFNAAPGTTVIVRDGRSDDKVTAEIKKLLTLEKMPSEKPKNLTGADLPHTDNWRIEDVPHDVDFIQGSQNNS